MARYPAKHRPPRHPRRLLMLISLTATAIAFVAPAAQAASTLSIDKTSTDLNGGTLQPGDTIEYTIVISNAGPDTATGVTLRDDTPANTTYVTGSATISDTTTIDPSTNPFHGAPLSIDDIPFPGSTTATFRVTVNSPLPNLTSINNTATVSSPDDAASPKSSGTSDPVTSAPALTVTKSASPPAGNISPGDSIDYTVVIESTGTDQADDVTITDATPANTTYVPGSAELDGAPVADNPTAPINPFEDGEDLGDMAGAPIGGPYPSHTITFSVVVNSPLMNGTTITNTATATSTNAPDASGSVSHTVVSMPGLTIDKTSSPTEGGTVIPGTTITYTIVVTNDSLATETATGVSVTDPTPTDTTYVAGSTELDGAPVPDNPTAPLNPLEDGEALPDMQPGDSHTFTFDVVVDTPLDDETLITNTATLSHDQGPDTSNDATLTVDSAPELTLVKTSAPAEGSRVTPGTTIIYTIVVQNAATATEVADELELLDPTPANTSYVEGSGTLNGAAVTGTGNPFGTAFDLPDLDPDESHTITFSIRVNSPLARGTVISNQAELTAENHPDLQDAATHTVDSAPVLKLILSSSPAPGTKLEADETIRYTIVVQNDAAATESLTNVQVFAPIPAGTTFVEGSATLNGATFASPDSRLAAPGPFQGGFSLGTMEPGRGHTISYRVRVKASADQITNRVTVTADNASATIATLSHRGPNSGAGAGAGGAGGDGGGGGTGTGGTGTETGGGLAFTGLDLLRLLLLAITLLLAGWTLVARGRAVQRRVATGRSDEPVPSTGSVTVDRWVDAWFYP